MSEPDFMTADEVAKLLGIGRATVYAWASARDSGVSVDAPAHYRFGERRVRWDRKDVMNWLQAQRRVA